MCETRGDQFSETSLDIRRDPARAVDKFLEKQGASLFQETKNLAGRSALGVKLLGDIGLWLWR